MLILQYFLFLQNVFSKQCNITLSNCTTTCQYQDCTLVIPIKESGNIIYTMNNFIVINSSIEFELHGNYSQNQVIIQAQNISLDKTYMFYGYPDSYDYYEYILNQNHTGIQLIAEQSLIIISSTILIEQSLRLKSNNVTYLNNTLIESYKFGLYSNNTFINKTIIGSEAQYCKTQCSCLSITGCSLDTLPKYADYVSLYLDITHEYRFMTPSQIQQGWSNIIQKIDTIMDEISLTNFSTYIITSNTLYLQEKSLISGSYIGIYSHQLLLLDSKITSEGYGCLPSMGFGCGYLDWIIGLREQCGGTGGSHGGKGGISTSYSSKFDGYCQLMHSRETYDDPFKPLFEGSGGGALQTIGNEGYAGGVIYIESYLVTLNGTVTASGRGSNNINYGAGSGGTIQIRTFAIEGSGEVSVTGGGSLDQQYGGIGGGGRLLVLVFQDEFYNFIQFKGSHGTIPRNQLNYAASINYNWIQNNGSMIMKQCSQGYEQSEMMICLQCPTGYYKALYSFGTCQKCINYSPDAVYSGAQLQPFCQIQECSSDEYLNNEGYCVSQFQAFSESLGGENGLFALVFILLLLIVNIIVVWWQRQSNQNEADSVHSSSLMFEDDTLQREQSFQKGYFTTQDLHYHIKRIYLGGDNTYSSPWYIYPGNEAEFTQQTNDQLELLFQNFNKQALYPLWEKCLLIAFKYYYYPIYLLLSSLFANMKIKKLQRILEETKSYVLNTQETGDNFKFSCSPDQILGYLDILNYKQNLLEWSTITQFPVHLLLAGLGTLICPLSINIRDPLVKLLWISVNQQDHSSSSSSDGEVDQEKEQEKKVNSIDSFVQKFNYFAKFIEFRASKQSFAKHFRELIQFVEESKTNIFEADKKFKLEVFIYVHVIATNDNYKSKVVILNSQTNEKELTQILYDIHYMINYLKQEYQVKFSIKFDELNPKLKLKEQLIILETENDINEQICDNQQLFDERYLFTNWKKKMMEKMGEEVSKDSESSYSFMDIFQQVQRERRKNSQESYLYRFELFMLNLETGFSWVTSQISRYRRFYNVNENTIKILFGLLVLFALIEAFLSVAYPVILSENIKDEKLRDAVIAESIFQIIFYPFSEIITPILLIIWLFNSSVKFGKFYLIFNICAIIRAFIEFCFSTYEVFLNSSVWLLLVIKIISIGLMILTSHLMCFQLINSETQPLK